MWPQLGQSRLSCGYRALIVGLTGLALACGGSNVAETDERAIPVAGHSESGELERALEQLASRSRSGILESIEGFERLSSPERLERLSTDQLASLHAGLAEASALAGLYSLVPPGDTMPRARRAAHSALELAPSNARTHASLGLVEYLWSWDFEAAEHHFQEAIRLDPTLANASLWYGMMLSALGRSAEAVEQAERAGSADPDSRLIQTKTITILVAANELDRARRQYEQVIAQYGPSALALRELAFLELAAADAASDPAEERRHLIAARDAFQEADDLAGGAARSTAGVAYSSGRLGDRSAAAQSLEVLEARTEAEHVPPLYLALAHLGTGRPDAALAHIDRAHELRDPGLVYLKSRPGLRDLAGQERYEEVARAVGL